MFTLSLFQGCEEVDTHGATRNPFIPKECLITRMWSSVGGVNDISPHLGGAGRPNRLWMNTHFPSVAALDRRPGGGQGQRPQLVRAVNLWPESPGGCGGGAIETQSATMFACDT